MLGRSISGFHQPGRHCLHQARSAVRCSASRTKGKLHPTKNKGGGRKYNMPLTVGPTDRPNLRAEVGVPFPRATSSASPLTRYHAYSQQLWSAPRSSWITRRSSCSTVVSMLTRSTIEVAHFRYYYFASERRGYLEPKPSECQS